MLKEDSHNFGMGSPYVAVEYYSRLVGAGGKTAAPAARGPNVMGGCQGPSVMGGCQGPSVIRGSHCGCC